jgi:predicted Fe-Mo cluster-binding NifX family protein
MIEPMIERMPFPTSPASAPADRPGVPDGAVVVAVNLAADQVGSGWGKAVQVALATVADGALTDWQVHDVRWDVAHDAGGEGAHHARIVRFLRENGVQVAVSGHMGPPMQNTLAKLGVRVVLGATGDAQDAALAAAATGS